MFSLYQQNIMGSWSVRHSFDLLELLRQMAHVNAQGLQAALIKVDVGWSSPGEPVAQEHHDAQVLDPHSVGARVAMTGCRALVCANTALAVSPAVLSDTAAAFNLEIKTPSRATPCGQFEDAQAVHLLPLLPVLHSNGMAAFESQFESMASRYDGVDSIPFEPQGGGKADPGAAGVAARGLWAGWPGQARLIDADSERLLLKNAIFTEDHYRRHERMLSAATRHEVARLRYRALAGRWPEDDDVIQNLSACPSWVVQLPVDSIAHRVPSGVVSALLNLGVHRIGDVSAVGVRKLHLAPKFGAVRYQRLIEVVRALFGESLACEQAIATQARLGTVLLLPPQAAAQDSGATASGASSACAGPKCRSRARPDTAAPNLSATASGEIKGEADRVDGGLRKSLHRGAWPHPAGQLPAAHEFPTLAMALSDAASKLRDSERGIWAALAGYKCKRHSLQDVACDLGVSRQRVFKIQEKIVARVARHRVWPELRAALMRAIQACSTAVRFCDLPQSDPWFGKVDDFFGMLQWAFDRVLHKEFALVCVGADRLLVNMSERSWSDFVARTETLLRKAASEAATYDCVVIEVRAMLPQECMHLSEQIIAHADAGRVIWSSAADSDPSSKHGLGFNKAVASTSGQRRALGFGQSLESAVRAVMESSARPLHFKEITRRVAHLTHDKRQPASGSVHQVAKRVGILLAPGTYGLIKHMPVSPARIQRIGQAAQEIVEQGPDTRQWHRSELLERLRRNDPDLMAGVDAHILGYALSKCERLADLRRMMVGKASVWGQGRAELRVPVSSTIERLLEQSGKALTTRQIRDLLHRQRGLSARFQIQQSKAIVRVAPSTFALRSWLNEQGELAADRLPLMHQHEQADHDRLQEAARY